MTLPMSPGILAAICILSVELIVIIFVIGYLLWRRHGGPRNKSEIPAGNYESKEPKDKDSLVVESETQTDAESQTDVMPAAEETPTPAPRTSEPPSAAESESSEEEPSEEECSSEEEEEEDNEKRSDGDLSEEEEEVKEEDPVVEEPVEKVDAEAQMQAPPSLSRQSSTSSESSSSSNESESENEELEEKEEEVEVSPPAVEETVAEEKAPEKEEEIPHEAPEEDKFPPPPAVSIERNPSQSSRVPSIDIGGGITLSLRIERGSETTPKVTVNGRSVDRGNSYRSLSSAEEAERPLRRISSQPSEGIEVIRRYEPAPERSENVFDSASRKQSETHPSGTFRPSSLTSDEGSDEMTTLDEAVAGVINVTSGEKLTICQAMNKGLIPRKTALLLLEAQAATGSVVNPRNGVKLSVQGGIDLGIVDESYRQTLIAAEGAYYGYLDPRTAETVCLSGAMSRGIFPKAQGMRLLEAQVATGGVIDPWTGARYSLDAARERGLIDDEFARALGSPDELMDFFDPTTRTKLNYADLLSKCIRDLDTGLRFLYIEERPVANDMRYQPDLLTFRSAFRKKVTLQELIDAGLVEDPILDAFRAGKLSKEELRDVLQPFLVGDDAIAGVLNKTTHKVLSICQAVKTGLLRRGTALELLEAQAATGSIVDPFTGKKMSVGRAVSSGLVDKEYENALRNAEQAVHGFAEPGTKRLISLFEAMRKGMVIEIHGIRMLEAQLATGGLIDPEAGYRIPTAVALERGLFDYRMADILTTNNTDLKGYYDPTTGVNTTYAELLRRCVKNKRKNGGTLLLPVKDQAPMAAAMHKGAYRHRKVIVTDPTTKRHLSVDQAVDANVIDEQTARELSKSEGVWNEPQRY